MAVYTFKKSKLVTAQCTAMDGTDEKCTMVMMGLHEAKVRTSLTVLLEYCSYSIFNL